MPVFDPAADLVALAQIKAAQEALAVQKAEIEERLITAIEGSGHKSLSIDYDGDRISGTVVRGERTIIHEDDLKKVLSTQEWNKVSSRVLDKEKLEAAVVQNIVDRNVVAAASEIKANKPFVKVTHKLPDKTLLPGVGFDGAKVTVTNSAGQPKPAARKRVAKPRRS